MANLAHKRLIIADAPEEDEEMNLSDDDASVEPDRRADEASDTTDALDTGLQAAPADPSAPGDMAAAEDTPVADETIVADETAGDETAVADETAVVGEAAVADETIVVDETVVVDETCVWAEAPAVSEAPAAHETAVHEDMVETAETAEAADAEAAADTQPEERPEELRLLEALLFAASEPVDEKTLAARMPEGVDVHAALRRLQVEYAPRGVNLVRVAKKWAFRTANDLAWLLTHESVEPKKLSRAAIETLSIIAYHQPVTRAEIEEIRGVSAAKGTIDVLLETGWIRPRGRRKAPGRPLTYGTTEAFLSHFGLESLTDLPGLDELKGSGLLDGRLPPGFSVPMPSDDPALREDEDPLEPGDLDLTLAPRLEPEPEQGGQE